MNSRHGVFAVSRRVWTHPILDEPGKPFSRREAWLWLLSEAAWQDEERQQGCSAVALRRGQVCHSLRFLSEAWNWTLKRTRCFVRNLEKHGMVTVQKGPNSARNRGTAEGTAEGTRASVLTICNYSAYQFASEPRGTAKGTPEGTNLKKRIIPYLRKGADRASNVIPTDPDIPADPKAVLFSEAKPWLCQLGKSKDSAGRVIGRWLKEAHDDAGLVLSIVREARSRQLSDPVAWVMAAIKERDDRRERERNRFQWGRQ